MQVPTAIFYCPSQGECTQGERREPGRRTTDEERRTRNFVLRGHLPRDYQ